MGREGVHNQTLFREALLFALEAHGEQLRKGSAVPYITHPVGVATVLAQYEFDAEVVAAGLLHDVVEDAGVPVAELARRFGERVAALVEAITERKHDEVPGAPLRPWEIRKAELLSRLEGAPLEAVALKAADALHNAQSILRDVRVVGPGVWQRFRRGREDQLGVLDAVVSLVRRRAAGSSAAVRLAQLGEELAETVEQLRRESVPSSTEAGPIEPLQRRHIMPA
mgnify:CR=1 FL=1